MIFCVSNYKDTILLHNFLFHFNIKMNHFPGHPAGHGSDVDHHRPPGAVCHRADGWILLPVRCGHRPVVQNIGTQQGGGYNRRFIRARKR